MAVFIGCSSTENDVELFTRWQDTGCMSQVVVLYSVVFASSVVQSCTKYDVELIPRWWDTGCIS